ncbi:hypothetical protein 1 [Beihai picorna-like virus 30]|uniref:hypothetical protein 1 n=1 Tax=Beihai picorna-like virus 30 TaxID=1922573 RepID=UPI000909A953|nr:hypothetical protein 1 [Beihai picorna-like virus 30]APG76853.1 hypothetical protein 1 [Beihai picorna-like virus 30]
MKSFIASPVSTIPESLEISTFDLERPDTGCSSEFSDSTDDYNYFHYASDKDVITSEEVVCVAFGRRVSTYVARDFWHIYGFCFKDISTYEPQRPTIQKRAVRRHVRRPAPHRPPLKVPARDFDAEINAHLADPEFFVPHQKPNEKGSRNKKLAKRVRYLCAVARQNVYQTALAAELMLRDSEASREEQVDLVNQGLTDFFMNQRKTISGAVQAAERLRKFQEAISYKASSPADMTGNLLARFEDLVAFFTNVANCKNMLGFVSALHLYVRTFYTGSVATAVMDHIAKLFGDGYDSFKRLSDDLRKFSLEEITHGRHETELTNQGFTDEWNVKEIKDCLKNWRGFHKTTFAQKLGNIVSTLVTFGFCPNWEEDPIKLGTFEIFKAKCWDMQDRSNDFIDMIIDTLIFFVERGIAAFEAKDLTLLLYDDAESARIELEYATLTSALPALTGGRLSDLKDKQGFKDINDFEVRLDKLISLCGSKIKSEKNPHAKTVFTNRYVVLKKMETELVMLQKRSPVKDAPFAVMVHSGSNMAKTTVTNVIAKTILEGNEFQSTKEFIVFMNDCDAYETEIQAWHTCVVLDDFGNTAPEHYKDSPLARIISLKNNIPKAALKADVDSKGNVIPRPKLLMVPTNVRHMHAHIFSSEPASILRRMDYVVDLFLRPGYVDESTGGVDTSKIEGQFCPDAWRIRISHYKIIRHDNKLDTVVEIVDREDITLQEARMFLLEKSKEFYRRQKVYVKHTEEMFDCEFCEHLYPPTVCPTCNAPPPLHVPADDDEIKLGSLSDHALDKKSKHHCLPPRPSPPSPPPVVVEEEELLPLPQSAPAPERVDLIAARYARAKKDLQPRNKSWQEKSSQFEDAHEDHSLGNQGFTEFIEKLHGMHQEESNPVEQNFEQLFNPLASFTEGQLENSRRVKPKPFYEDLVDRYVQNKIDDAISGCVHFCETIPEQIKACSHFGTLQEAFDKHKTEVLSAIAGVALGVGIFVAIKGLRDMAKQSELVLHGQTHSAKTEEEAPTPLPGEKENPWKLVSPVAIPKSEESRTATLEQVIGTLKKHVAHVWIEKPEHNCRSRCDIVPLKSNLWLIPHHMLVPGKMIFHVEKDHPDYVGQRFEQAVCDEDWVEISNDFAVIRLVKGGAQPELLKFFATGPWDLTDKLFAKSVYKKESGEIDVETFKVTKKRRYADPGLHRPFDGFEYQYPRDTEEGMCMMPLVSCQRKPAIIGFHMAGEKKGPRGVASIPSVDEILKAADELEGRRGLTCHSATYMTTEKYGIDFTPQPTVPSHHSVNFLAEDQSGQRPSAEVYGQHPKGSVKFKSGVRKSPISDSVAKQLEMPRVHGPPSHYKIWRHWHRDLDNMTHPKGNFDPEIMNLAHDDLKDYWRNYCSMHPDEVALVKPYPWEVMINGADGVNSVDRIDASTSMGWPLNKAKKHFMILSDEEFPGVTVNMDFEDPEVKRWVDFLEGELAAGRRINAIFRANLKDEPTKFTKDKIRVFAGCEVAFTLLARKYYLPIVRFIQNSKNELECAVGINATSPQWTEFAERLKKFDSTRFGAGDYKAFDKTMTIEMIMRAFDILTTVAEEAGYDERSLRIMRGIASEISQPLYEYDGIFILIFGSNPSGHPLTVIINNIVNSLYMRYAYYKFHEYDCPLPFASRIVLGCYGDDNVYGFHPDEDMGMDDIGRILGECGITYTTADKKVITQKGCTWEELSFLKRGFLWDEELGHYLAPLEEASISKSLHNYMKRKGSEELPETIAAGAIHAANREFFYFGKAEFNKRRKQLQAVCEEVPSVGKYVGDLPDYEDLKATFLSSGKRTPVQSEPVIMEFGFGPVRLQ